MSDQPKCEIDEDGTKRWYLHHQLHRENGPAIEYANGHKEWFLYGELHRKDGPALEYTSGYKAWYLHDKLINCSSQQEFERLLKLKAFW